MNLKSALGFGFWARRGGNGPVLLESPAQLAAVPAGASPNARALVVEARAGGILAKAYAAVRARASSRPAIGNRPAAVVKVRAELIGQANALVQDRSKLVQHSIAPSAPPAVALQVAAVPTSYLGILDSAVEAMNAATDPRTRAILARKVLQLRYTAPQVGTLEEAVAEMEKAPTPETRAILAKKVRAMRRHHF
jgi:hypothetical protein